MNWSSDSEYNRVVVSVLDWLRQDVFGELVIEEVTKRVLVVRIKVNRVSGIALVERRSVVVFKVNDVVKPCGRGCRVIIPQSLGNPLPRFPTIARSPVLTKDRNKSVDVFESGSVLDCGGEKFVSA